MIEVQNLYKSFDGFNALNGLCVKVEKGSIYGLMGVNGSGKTTLIKHLTGVLRQDDGSVKIGGEEVYENENIKAKCAFIPDELFFFGNYTLESMAKFYAGVYPNWSKERFEKMCADFKLKKNGRISRFSKGMQKQAAFILAMSSCPEYLIMDEPIDGLDPIIRQKVWNYVVGDVADKQMTVLISSHNADELEGICDSIGLIAGGEMKLEGSLDEIKESMNGITLRELFIKVLGGEEYEA